MDPSAIYQQLPAWWAPAGRRLKRALVRSAPVRLALLGLLNLVGTFMMLSPLLITAGATVAAVNTYRRIQGPLDWFMIEVLAAIAAFSIIISYQLVASRVPGAPGAVIARAHHARFCAILDRRVRHFNTVPVRRARLTTAVEIEIAVTPRWPVPLWHKRTLHIGAPLMFFCSEPAFRLALAGAVAADARLSGGIRGWVAQASMDWPHIVAALEQRPSLAARLLLPPARWLSGVNHALNEDMRSAQRGVQCRWIMEQSGENAAAEFLTTLVLAGSFLARLYWPMVLKAAEHCPTPVVRPFSHFELLLRKTLTMTAARRWVLQAQAGPAAAGPAFRDLLADLKLDHLNWTGLPGQNAFETIFGDAGLLKELDTAWRQDIAAEWTRRHTRFQKQKMRFEQLQEKSRQQVLRGDSAINYVRLAARFLDTGESISVYRRMYADNPDNAALGFVCGQELLAAGELQEGIDALQHAAELDSALANRVHAIINAHRQSWMARKQVRAGIAEIA